MVIIAYPLRLDYNYFARIYIMTQYRRAIGYNDFMALTPVERKEHSNYFLQQNPELCPVVLNVDHMGKPVELKMCKYSPL
jgi:hypothetical protein